MLNSIVSFVGAMNMAACDCSDLLSGSRTSRLYTQLVETGQAYHANAIPSYPGEKHPNALVLIGQPSSGVSLQTLDQAFQKETQGLIQSGPTAKEMTRIKKVKQFACEGACIVSAQVLV